MDGSNQSPTWELRRLETCFCSDMFSSSSSEYSLSIRVSRNLRSFSSDFKRTRSASLSLLSRPKSEFSWSIRSRSLRTLSSSWRSCLISFSRSNICMLRDVSRAADSLSRASSCSMPVLLVTFCEVWNLVSAWNRTSRKGVTK